MTPGLYYDLPAKDYHADPCDRPSLSASLASVLVSQSPLHAWQRHPKLGRLAGDPEAGDPEARDRGSLLHQLVLGVGNEHVVIDATDYRTKAAQESRDEARANGMIPILAAKYEELERVAKKILDRIAALGVDWSGDSEVTAIWESNGVLCRGRFDHLILADGMILDLKTCVSASPKAIQRHMITYGCDVQHAAYRDALRSLYPEWIGRERMHFLFCETSPPFDVVMVEPAGSMWRLGQSKWDRAVFKWGECLESGIWPGYSNEIVRIESPVWALDEETL